MYAWCEPTCVNPFYYLNNAVFKWQETDFNFRSAFCWSMALSLSIAIYTNFGMKVTTVPVGNEQWHLCWVVCHFAPGLRWSPLVYVYYIVNLRSCQHVRSRVAFMFFRVVFVTYNAPASVMKWAVNVTNDWMMDWSPYISCKRYLGGFCLSAKQYSILTKILTWWYGVLWLSCVHHKTKVFIVNYTVGLQVF